MSGFNDRDVQWFPRNCASNHAIKIFVECGAIAAPA
jgi:hypothetical protein